MKHCITILLDINLTHKVHLQDSDWDRLAGLMYGDEIDPATDCSTEILDLSWRTIEPHRRVAQLQVAGPRPTMDWLAQQIKLGRWQHFSMMQYEDI